MVMQVSSPMIMSNPVKEHGLFMHSVGDNEWILSLGPHREVRSCQRFVIPSETFESINAF